MMTLNYHGGERMVIINEVTQFGIFEVVALFLNPTLRFQTIVPESKSFRLVGNPKKVLEIFCSKLCLNIYDFISKQKIETLEDAIREGYDLNKPPTVEKPRTYIYSNSRKNSDSFEPFFTFHTERPELIEYLSSFSKETFKNQSVKYSTCLLFLRYLACYIGVPIVMCQYSLRDSKLTCTDVFQPDLFSLRSPTRVGADFVPPQNSYFVLQTTVGIENRLHCLLDVADAFFQLSAEVEVPQFAVSFGEEPSAAHLKQLEQLEKKYEEEEKSRYLLEEEEKKEKEERKKKLEEDKKLSKEKAGVEKRMRNEEEKKMQDFENLYRG
jgi:hypothetical protein